MCTYTQPCARTHTHMYTNSSAGNNCLLIKWRLWTNKLNRSSYIVCRWCGRHRQLVCRVRRARARLQLDRRTGSGMCSQECGRRGTRGWSRILQRKFIRRYVSIVSTADFGTRGWRRVLQQKFACHYTSSFSSGLWDEGLEADSGGISNKSSHVVTCPSNGLGLID